MKHIDYIFLVSLLVLSVVGCDSQQGQVEDSVAEDTKPLSTQLPAADAAEEQITATILEFDEVEAGVDPYRTRMTVSERYIRIDDSMQSDGFVLFDREKERIFSVVHSNQTILVVDPLAPLQPVPDDLQITAQLQPDENMPTLGGVQPTYYQFYANGQLCYHLVAALNFLPDIASAIQSYQMVLAAQQQETLQVTPAELQTPCFLANYVYAPHEYMSKGFPLEQWDVTGYRRSFNTVEEDVVVPESLFELPDDYNYMSVGGGTMQM